MKLIPILAIAPFMAMIPPANAQTIPTGYFRDATNTVYLMGQAAGGEATLTYIDVLKSRTIQADNCGRVIWKTTATNPVPRSYSTDGGNIFFSTTLPTGEITRCNPDGQAANNGTSGTYRTAIGDLVISNRTPNSPIAVTYKVNKARKAKANLCGVVRWAANTTYVHNYDTRVAVDGGELVVTGLEEKTAPICRQGNLLIPATWLTGEGTGGFN
jgi:hypothetical protein